MKIIFLDFDDIKNPLLGAGQAKATYEIGRRLASYGHTVEVICSWYPGALDRTQDLIYYRHIGIHSGNIRLNNLFYILSLPFLVPFLKADVIFECFTAPISTLFTPLFTRIPVVVIPSSFEADRFTKRYHLPFNQIEHFGLKFYKYILPYSEYTDHKIKKYNPGIISRIVPEGVDLEFFKIKSVKPKFILFLGRFDISQKGIDLLLRSFALVKDQIGYPLHIAGAGPDESKIKQLIGDLGLTQQVKIIGPTYGTTKTRVLSESLFVAFTSRDETFSCFALEALASGLPLVAFDIPGLCWTDPRSVLKAPAFDLDAYSKLLLTAARPKINLSMRQAARKFAKKFSWDGVSRDYEQFITQVVNRKI